MLQECNVDPITNWITQYNVKDLVVTTQCEGPCCHSAMRSAELPLTFFLVIV